MSRYVLLGAALAIITTLVCMRVLAPQRFNSIFGNTVNPNVPPKIRTKVRQEAPSPEKKIQLALLLDTSNSMDGLIEQAKSQLWKMVNALANMEKDGQPPIIEIALFQFGNDFLLPSDGYVQQISPLTTDLDEISKQLFALTTNGGSEFCAYVLHESLEELYWSPDAEDLRIIFIAGNESFAQGPIHYNGVCQAAAQADIIINTIYCGSYEEGLREGWKSPAELAFGQFMNIDQSDQVKHIETPFDEKILELNRELNTTYIYYGKDGRDKLQNLEAQDSNASSLSRGNSRTRAIFKAKKAYKNEHWDLVDYTEANEEGLDELEKEELPEELRKMTSEQQKSYIESMRKKRHKIQDQIKGYEERVKDYIANIQTQTQEQNTLDQVLEQAIFEQASKKRFKLPE